MSLSVEEIEQYHVFADQLADASARAIMPHFRAALDVSNKGEQLYDPVTVADRAAERSMRELIQAVYPDHGILGEEEESFTGTSPLTWVLDPIDGTRAFITGLPLWGTLIALNDGQRPCLGVMNQPFTGERFSGSAQGTWLNGRPLRTRACSSLAEATMMATSLEIFTTRQQRGAFDHLAHQAQLVRFGGDCYAYCMLAAGLVDVIMEASLQPYDVQALIPIVEGAGGKMTTWLGGDAQHGGLVLACGDPQLHDELVSKLTALGPFG
ncbi:histidinol-phosphatase [Halopseudomonas pelagia]|uniref:histidinol-phosphatase n=1 Tax=Halopseudomonas pelagia TaxID=553151 RepID=UPI0003A1C235|nr:histidinol-phosphatase [Halopseudomonas pelagia]|tara:strand:- start:344349 stop:345149 length:801 start_codon:yes stop_codon:yes gene_type:complete